MTFHRAACVATSLGEWLFGAATSSVAMQNSMAGVTGDYGGILSVMGASILIAKCADFYRTKVEIDGKSVQGQLKECIAQRDREREICREATADYEARLAVKDREIDRLNGVASRQSDAMEKLQGKLLVLNDKLMSQNEALTLSLHKANDAAVVTADAAAKANQNVLEAISRIPSSSDSIAVPPSPTRTSL